MINRRHDLKAFAAAALCPLCPTSGFAADAAHWSYEGTTGPEKWGDLDAASKVCSVGSQQSPLDIVTPVKSDLPSLKIAWGKRADTILNNGHTIQLNFTEGSTLSVGKENYSLLQFHFHRPSEHKVAGKSFPMEVHFVHRTAAGALGVRQASIRTRSCPQSATTTVMRDRSRRRPAPRRSTGIC
jgi:carbonic anhydrase